MRVTKPRNRDRDGPVDELFFAIELAIGLVFVYVFLLGPGTLGAWALYQGEPAMALLHFMIQIMFWGMFAMLNVL